MFSLSLPLPSHHSIPALFSICFLLLILQISLLPNFLIIPPFNVSLTYRFSSFFHHSLSPFIISIPHVSLSVTLPRLFHYFLLVYSFFHNSFCRMNKFVLDLFHLFTAILSVCCTSSYSVLRSLEESFTIRRFLLSEKLCYFRDE